ncbi:MAG: YitT family protein [Cellulosilyticaceae bacterium]
MKLQIQVKKISKMIGRSILNLFGVLIYAIGINCFAAPHKIAPGGASGIAILLNYLVQCPIGLFVFLFNVPLLVVIVRKKYFSNEFVLKTLATTLLLSVVTDYGVVLLPAYKGDPLLAGIFSGVLMGSGLALVHIGTSNTGGISLLALILQKLNPQLSVGKTIAFLNSIIVITSGIVYHTIESVLYAMITVYICGIFMDNILENVTAKNLMIVISERTSEVREIFLKEHKGITVLEGEGGYSGNRQKVLLCAMTRNDCGELQKEIKHVDNQSLIIITQASKVEGKGFNHFI